MLERFSVRHRLWSLPSVVLLAIAACGGRTRGTNPGVETGSSIGGAMFGTTGSSSAQHPEDTASDATSPQVADAGPDAADALAGVVVCSGPQDCLDSPRFFNPPSDAEFFPAVACCVANTCIFGDEAAASSCGEPGTQDIAATSYDLSCATDSDCTLVALGDFCHPGANGCPLGTISQKALPEYNTDIAGTYALQCGVITSCPVSAACCRNGKCVTDACFSPEDTLPACADAGGVCQLTDSIGLRAVCTGPNVGPPDSCAFPDEMCCATSH